MNQISNTAIMRDGAKITYNLYEGKGKTRFVLVHSLAMDGNFWLPVIEHLKHAGDVLVYDCRGHGSSDKSVGPYTCEGFADDLADLLEHVGWASAVVAGASMGGCVSIAFAGRYPNMLDGLGLIDTTAWYGPDAPLQWEDRAQKALAGGLSALVNFQKTRWVSEKFLQQNPSVVDAAIKVFLANNVQAYAETCRMLGNFDGRDVLPSIVVPVTVLVGEEDYAAPVSMAEAMHHNIKNSTLHILKGVRHLTPLECPEIIAARLIDVTTKQL
jgi:3-oxoadipate enol-lactonase